MGRFKAVGGGWQSSEVASPGREFMILDEDEQVTAPADVSEMSKSVFSKSIWR
jgi:hypothetical protein